jgi:DNA mismatch endonuclease (patch repair protein)
VSSRLHKEGSRFRVHYPVPSHPKRSIDIAFTKWRVAVFLDGCFWHGCPLHGTMPKRNAAFWASKIRRNKQRDLMTDALLSNAGWRVVRIWEHEDVSEAVARIQLAVNDLRKTFSEATKETNMC